MPSSMGSSQLKDQLQVSCIAGGFYTDWATREAHTYILYMHICVCMLTKLTQSCLTLRPCGLTLQAPLSMGFSRQESWSGFLFPPPGALPYPGVEPTSLMSPELAGRFLIRSTPRKLICVCMCVCVCVYIYTSTHYFIYIYILSSDFFSFCVFPYYSLTCTSNIVSSGFDSGSLQINHSVNSVFIEEINIYFIPDIPSLVPQALYVF